MSKTEDDKRQLKERISALENENRLLKERLAKAGVSYADTYWRDISEARSNVVISSPRLNNEKVNRIIAELSGLQQRDSCRTVGTDLWRR